MNQGKFGAYTSIVLSMVFWSLSYIWIKIIYQVYNPITTVFFRVVFSALFMLLLAKLFKKLQKIKKKDYKAFILITFFHPFMYFLCESSSLKFVSPTIAAVIVATIPLFIPIISFYILKERLSGINVLGLIVSFTGILLVIVKKDYSLSANPFGLGLLFMAVAAGTGFTISLQKLSSKYNAFTIVTYQNLIGMFWLLPVFLVFDLNHFLQATPNLKVITSMVLLVILATSLAFILFTYSVRELGASRASIFNNTIPVFTAILSWRLLEEELSIRMIAGIAIVIGGLLVAQLKSKQP